MKKKLITRGFLGFPLGIALGYVITVIISACIGDGHYYAARPELIRTMGTEINAVVLQTVLCGVMGAGFAMASVIWEIDTWSIAKQTGFYFAIIFIVLFPISYIANWMKHSIGSVLIYIGVYVLVFAVVWFIQYTAWKRKIKQLNDDVQKTNVIN